MNKIKFLLTCCLIVNIGYTQSYTYFKKGDKLGIKDSYGKTIVDARFTNLRLNEYGKVDFVENRAAVEIDSLWGFIDQSGKIVIDIQYQDVNSFNGFSLTRAKKNNKYGFINLYGEEVLPIKYDYVQHSFSPSQHFLKISSNGKTGFINRKGEIVVPLIYDNAIFDLNTVSGGWGGFFDYGLAPVCINCKYHEFRKRYVGGKWGMIDTTGKVMVPIEYEDITYDHRYGNKKESLILAAKNGKMGALKFNGETIIHFEYDHIQTEARYPFLTVTKNRKLGLVSRDGSKITDIKYDFLGGFCEGLAQVTFDRKQGFINENGQEVVPVKYEDTHYCFSDGMTAVKINNKWGFIDLNGKVVIPFQYDEIFFDNGSGLFYDNRIKVKNEGREFFINKKGDEIK